MEWEPAAQARLERVPFFVRKKVKKQIEEFVARKGGQVVTSQDVTDARRSLAGDPAQTGDDAAVSLHTARGSLSPAELSRIEEIVEKGVAMEGLKTRYHEVKMCGGAAGCPLTLVEDRKIARKLADVLEDAGLDRHIAGQIDGPVLVHHKFKVTVAGCPNGCSQPQIADFGVIGQSRPGAGEGSCTNCGLCVNTCQENAIDLTGEGPVFDYARCLNCGDCIRVCPTGAIREVQAGYRVLVGGKLGRHPRLAEIIMEVAGEEEVLAALRATLRLFMEHGQDGERFAGLVERLGIERVRDYILSEAE